LNKNIEELILCLVACWGVDKHKPCW